MRSIRSLVCALTLAAIAPLAAAAPFQALPEDATLKQMLSRWAQSAGWRLANDSHPTDLSFVFHEGDPLSETERALRRNRLNAALSKSTDFPSALERMLSLVPSEKWGTQGPPLACLWINDGVYELLPLGAPCGSLAAKGEKPASS